jgi:hypothetical protein
VRDAAFPEAEGGWGPNQPRLGGLGTLFKPLLRFKDPFQTPVEF